MQCDILLSMSHKKNSEIADLKKSLLFFHVQELRDLSLKLSLLDKGDKKGLILRICHFLQTKEKIKLPKIPKESCAKPGKTYPIQEESLMLKGAYKNDLKNREFFRNLIGPYFHFTAFGIDWLNGRWYEGDPPTYLEFAHMWKQEYERRKKDPETPKEEWAYINFIKQFLEEFPKAGKAQIYEAWKAEREKHKEIAYRYIEKRGLLL